MRGPEAGEKGLDVDDQAAGRSIFPLREASQLAGVRLEASLAFIAGKGGDINT
jgi:hypothetical protein